MKRDRAERIDQKMNFHSGRYVLRLAFIVLFDIAIAAALPLFSLWMAYNFNLHPLSYAQRDLLLAFMPFFCALAIVVYYVARLYSVIWTYISIDIFYRGVLADLFLLLIQFSYIWLSRVHFPLNFYFIEFLLFTTLTTANRFFYRSVVFLIKSLSSWPYSQKRRRALLIGAGEAGHVLIKEAKTSDALDFRVVVAVDDNPNKHNRYIEGVKICGGRDKIPELVRRYGIDVLILALPTAQTLERQKILAICQDTKKDILIMPSVSEMMKAEGQDDAKVLSHKLRNIRMEDLLGREPVEVNVREIARDLSDKSVLITGAGGSIGSELARQIASFSPAHLILLDIYENNIYDIQMELQRRYPNLHLTVLIASVRDAHRVKTIFAHYRPQYVYHAAAHKHVPLMEHNPNEVVKNNVRGTYLCAHYAARYGARRFVLISTDKAVNPTNIMGASKRLCEMVIQDLNEKSPRTDFVAVRFGNVLGSNGSVIPLFRSQIEQGGPVTVTHPEIIRFFMTIPEAVNLVLQAGCYACGGEIFVLDMGEPVKILDLARNMIYLAGYEPERDIQIVFTGLRPGEKLYEEILMEEEGLKRTPNRKIFVARPIDFEHQGFEKRIEALMDLAWRDQQGSAIREAISRLVPTYHYAAAPLVESEDWEQLPEQLLETPAEGLPQSIEEGGEADA